MVDEEGKPRQRIGVDPVRLGVAGEEPSQIGGLRGTCPKDQVTALLEEHHYRQPRRAGGLHHNLQTGSLGGAAERGLLDVDQALLGRDTAAPTEQAAVPTQNHHSVLGRHPKVDSDQSPFCHHTAPSNPLRASSASSLEALLLATDPR